ncbi:ABC transporter ATP-binding protein [Desertimonas flava]|uniref:ABC transporter ATP-binding protein n=1 Tax=Desertimonas flava TaxID=2064846 RepID=UPI000E348A89|nr:ABC transporter ATP-binding protein [Desertimonas flava]
MLVSLIRDSIGPYRRQVVALLVLQAIGTIAALMLPSLNADIIDKGVATGDTGYIVATGGRMLLLTIVQIAGTISAGYFGAKVAMAAGRDLRAKIFHHVGSFSAREVNQFGAPSLITRTTNDVQQVQLLIVMTCTLLVQAPIMALGGIVMAMREGFALSWVLLVSIPALLLSIAFIVSRMIPGFRKVQERTDEINRVLREQISGIRVVRAFVRERSERARFATANDQLTDVSLAVGRWQAVLFPTVMLIFNVSSVGVIWFGGHLVNDGSLQVGSLSAFITYLMQILMSVMMATFVAVMAPRAAVCAERIREVLDTSTSVRPPATPVTDVTEHGTVELRDVSFHYPGASAPVLRGVSFRAAPGRTTAIIGSTGAGKTTLINLIPRLFDVTGGALLVDGVDVRDLDPDLLWGRIGLVPQAPYLFSGTIASNLRYGKPDATDEEMWDALTVAQAADFVRANPDGLEARISQGGTNLSGGQRQRMAIARALIRKPEIYLFDDAFSALDLGTDARLRAALRPRTRDAAVIIVAQRVSTVIDADEIVVIEDGVVIGKGRHAELLETCPTYVEIVDSQQSEEAA